MFRSSRSTQHDATGLPYRCPRCGSRHDFSSLAALKAHLMSEHEYLMSPEGGFGYQSPLLQAYHQQTDDLQLQLQEAKEKEMKNKMDRRGAQFNSAKQNLLSVIDKHQSHSAYIPGSSLSRTLPVISSPAKNRSSPAEHYSPNDAINRSLSESMPNDGSFIASTPFISTRNTNGRTVSDNAKSHHSDRPKSGTPNADLYHDYVKNLYGNNEDNKTKEKQWEMTQALTQAQQHVDSLRTNAKKFTEEQEGTISTLKDELKRKNKALSKAKKELKNLTSDRRRLQKDVVDLGKQNSKTEEIVSDLQEEIGLKENLINLKEKEISELIKHQNETRCEEQNAKKELDEYIVSLKERAEEAEDQLEQLRAQLLTSTITATPNPGHPIVNGNRDGHQSISGQPSPMSTGLVPENYPSLSTSGFHQSSLGNKIGRAAGAIYTYPDSGVGESRSVSQVAGETYPAPRPAHNVSQSLEADDNGIIWDNHHRQQSPPGGASSSGQQYFSPYGQQMMRQQDTNIQMSLREQEQRINQKMRQLRQQKWQLTEQRHLAAAQGTTTEDDITVVSEVTESEEREEFVSDLDHTDYHAVNAQMLKLVHQETSSQSRSPSSLPLSDYDLSYKAGTRHASPRALSSSNTHTKGSAKLSDSQKKKPSSPRSQRRVDALFCIFMYLDTKTLLKMALVCREWHDVSRHPALWRRVVLRKGRISSKFLRTLAGWCTQLQSLTLEGLRGRSKRPGEDRAVHSKSTRGSLEEGLEVLMIVARDSLVSLRIVDCGHIITDRCVWLASCHSRHLQRLAYISDTDPAGSEVIWALGAGCRGITTLILPPMFPNQRSEQFNNRCVQMIGKCWPNLRVLCIGGVEVNVKGLISVVKHCVRLQVLELDHMCEITEEVAVAVCQAGLKGLEALDFTFTPITPKAVLHFISACPQLSSVTVHVGISDYYEDTLKQEHKDQYQQIIQKLQNLKKRPGMDEIITIKCDYG